MASATLGSDDGRSNDFSYDPLPDDGIRLIYLHSPQAGHRVRCHLDTYSTITVPGRSPPTPYRALSYCWGDPKDTTEILVNGRSFHVTTNLERLLRQLSTMDNLTTLPFWVDAICIDQANPDERSTQVMRMNEIFAGAESVIAWLGPGDPEIAALFCAIQKGSRLINVRAFNLFADLPYWFRAWIVQELVVARSIILMTGASTIDFKSVIENLHHGNFDPEPVDRSNLRKRDFFVVYQAGGWPIPQRLLTLCNLRNQYQETRSLFMLDCLRYLRESQATDERDKIFSLLSLCQDGKDFVSKPSYSLSSRRLQQQITISLIKHWGLDVICFPKPMPPKHEHITTGVETNISADIRRPSWSPCWLTDVPQIHEHFLIDFIRGRVDLPGCLPSSEWRGLDICFPLEPDWLQVKGVIVRDIGETCSVNSPKCQSRLRDDHDMFLSILGISRNYDHSRQDFDDPSTPNLYRLWISWFSSNVGSIGHLWENQLEFLYDKIQRMIFNRQYIAYKAACRASDSQAALSVKLENLVSNDLASEIRSKMKTLNDLLCSTTFVTFHPTSSSFAFASGDVRAGDRLAVIRGCKIPVVLREVSRHAIPKHRWPPQGDPFFRRPRGERYWQVIGLAVVIGGPSPEQWQEQLRKEAQPIILV